MAKLVYTDPSGRELTVPLGPDSPVVSIGRAKDCTIRSNRKSVSRRHAEFHYQNGGYQVVDLNSSNGTYLIIDDQRQPVVDPQPLNHKDEVWCGDFVLHFLEEQSDSAPVGGAQDSFDQPVSGGVQGNFSQQPQSGRHAQSVTGDLNGDSAPPPPSNGVSGGVGGGVSVGRGSSTPPPSNGGDGGVSAGVSMGRGSATPPPVGNNGIGAGSSDPVSFGQESAPDSDQLQRLRDEKKSIQELADRQSKKIDDLQNQLDDARQAQQSGDDQSAAAEELQQQLEATRQERARLEEELELARQASNDAEQELQRASDKIDELRLQLDDSGGPSTADSGEIERLQKEIDNRDRDLEILENELEREAQSGQSLRNTLAEYEDELDELETKKQQLEQITDRLRSERDEALSKLDDGAGAGPEVEKLRNRIDELTEQLEAARSSQPNDAVADGQLQRLAEHAKSLDRIVDAIERCDLSGLSTVDRVRLESAIRETEPRQILSSMLEIVE